MRKRLLPFFILLFSFFISHADEGMWIPLMLKMKEAEMQSKGLKISAEEIFSNNNPSLKDAVVLFGTGCTGEIISDQGLVLTNHHCGRSQIQSLSTLEHDYISNGYWAYKKIDELPCPGLSVTFIIEIQNLTDSIIPFLNDSMTEQERESKVKELSTKLEASAVKGTQYKANIKPFYYGNEYYMFITEVFNDIRLVGAPPFSIGKFGGETDNWMWPRHTGDFSIFRIYADSSNKPAAYSVSNIPYKPKKSFAISTKGVQEGDFTMVYGFPGKTTEYLSSAAVELIQEVNDPSKVKIRDTKLKIWKQHMDENDTVRLKYVAKYATIANYMKKWNGEMQGLRKSNAVQMKKDKEKEFMQWVNADAERKKKYGSLLDSLNQLNSIIRPASKLNDYHTEALNGIELVSFINTNVNSLVELAKREGVSDDSLKAAATKVLTAASGFFKNYDSRTDKEVMASLLKLYKDSIDDSLRPDIYSEINSKYKNNYNLYADFVFAKTIFGDSVKLKNLLAGFRSRSVKTIQKDPAYRLARSIADNFRQKAASQYSKLNSEINLLQRTYMKAQMEMAAGKTLYPDANLTLRLSSGKVQGYKPRDGVTYSYNTTLDGLIEKYNPTNDDFEVPLKLRELYQRKDFGKYEVNGTVPVAFIASNHTTGGNSGSPVINAKGELIGTNYDRTWEGTLSDIFFNPNLARNITLDIRYTLFIIDKYAGAKNIIDELKLVE
jgi:hypothetical protein